jgi:cytochrome c biogenesis protein CcmG, thiol:disulfide interchange protein DsbE
VVGVVAALAAVGALGACAPSPVDGMLQSRAVGGSGRPSPEVTDSVQAGALPPCPSSQPDEDATRPVRPGRGLPRLTFDCLGAGPKVTLSGLRGRPAVVNVWASWCPPCAQEMPVLVHARRALADRVLFLGVDLEDTRENGLAWARDLGMNFPSVFDPDGDVKPKLGVAGPPVTVFLRADGTLAYVHQGMLTSSRQLSDLISRHLGVSVSRR